MAIDSVLIAGSGLALLVFPTETANRLGMPLFEERDWFARFAGLILVALAAHVATTSRSAGDSPFQKIAFLMIVVSASIASSIYVAPGDITGWRLFTICMGGLWSLLYAITLPIKTIGLQESEDSQ